MRSNQFFILFFALFCASACHILPSKKLFPTQFEVGQSNPPCQFLYDDTTGNDYLRQLRNENGLEKLVANAKNDRERALILLDFTHRQWSHSGSNQPEKSDPTSILAEAKTGKKFRCVEYGIVTTGVLQAIGLKSRVLGLQTRDVEITKIGAGHVLAEVYLADIQKWAMIDGQFNAMPELNNVPLNALEFQQAIFEKKPFKLVNLNGEIIGKSRRQYLKFIAKYLYFFDAEFDNRTIFKKEGSLPESEFKSVVLVPIGAKNPTVFQRKYPQKNRFYTHKIGDFYAAPPISAPQTRVSWEKLTTEPYRGKQDDIAFIDEKTGWYINGSGKIYHTENGGETWEKQLDKPGTFFRCIAFLDNKIGFAGTVGTDYFPNVTDTIPLYGTKDGGKTWNPVAYSGPYVKGLCAIDVVKESFINHGELGFRTHIFAVGRVGSPANSLISHDGGETWQSKSMNDDCKMLFDIKMLNKKEGFACAATDEDTEKSNALILKTIDGGQTWKKVFQSARPFEITWKVAFPTPKIGYVTIQSYNPDTLIRQQHVAKTVDGGETWAEIDLVADHDAREFGVAFLDEKHGFVGTMTSGFETKNGGETWQKIDLGKACNKIRIYKNAASGNFYGYSIGVNLFKMQLLDHKN